MQLRGLVITATIMYNGERDMQGSARALKAAPKLHNYNSARDKNNDTQRIHTHNAHRKL